MRCDAMRRDAMPTLFFKLKQTGFCAPPIRLVGPGCGLGYPYPSVIVHYA
ncbi:hypothetical protein CGMCC3_g2858 [Colletotrichum fructicola]|nr:uncharacterized protein CGMCC3_g2858 [Colletotrichum fructicola]KAE9581440.1 hypothetical protein CGMCC3_g2858 [Colletotrichum fructicola]